MKLPLPGLSKKDNSSYFLVLILRHEKAQAVIFEEKEGKVSVIGESEENFKTTIEDADMEELLGVTDKVISASEESLPPNIETQKTVFGLKGSWVEKDGIKKEYLSKLKKVCDELGLTPVGFLVVNEAIARLLQKEEGAPVSAVLAEIGKTYVSASLIRAGRIIEEKTGGILEDGLPKSVDTLLKSLESSEILPAKVIIFDSEKDLSQEFINHSWSKSLPFLHLPQIVNLASNFDARAVLFGATLEMGFEVLPEDLELPKETEEKAFEKLEDSTEEDDKGEDKPTETVNMAPAEFFGFVEEVDVKKEAPIVGEPTQSPTSAQFEEIPEKIKIENAERKALPFAAMSIVSGGIISAKKISGSIKIPKIPFNPLSFFGGRKITLLFFFFPIILILLFLYFYLFGSRATITLAFEPKKVEKSGDVLFTSVSGTNIDDNTIASEIVSVTEEGEASANATGKKEVGDKAKGSVTIFNNSESSRTLAEGSIITSSNGLDFTLDSKVTVASASGDVFSGTKPGTSKGNITASKFGTDYNLPSNTKFSVSGNSSIAAKNDDPFSGGTKKEVKVASKQDLQKLEEKITQDLKDKARDDLGKKIAGSKFLLPDFVSTSLTKKTFSKKEGEEATSVSLKGAVEFQGLAYDKTDQVTFVSQMFEEETNNDLKLDEKSINLDIEKINKRTKDSIDANIKIIGELKVELDKGKLAKELAGKRVKDAKERLNGLPQLSDSEVSVFPGLPLIGSKLPRSDKNIVIVVK